MPLPASAIADIARAYTAAWNSGDPNAVASFYAEDGEIIINRGDPWTRRTRVADMAAGFYADVPDLSLTCDDIRVAGDPCHFRLDLYRPRCGSEKRSEHQRMGGMGPGRGRQGASLAWVVRRR